MVYSAVQEVEVNETEKSASSNKSNKCRFVGESNMTQFFELAQQELERAEAKHPPIHSLHEAYAVILEEVDEFKAEVWKQQKARDPRAICAELLQIAAMCARTAYDLDLLKER